MKKLLLSFCLVSAIMVFSQTARTPYPNSIIDIGVGAGANHGMLGGQLVVGYKGNGLLVGAGPFGWQAGVQASYRWLFASFSYGVYAYFTEVTTYRRSYPILGYIAMAGVKLNLIKSKRLYLKLAGGYGYWGYAYIRQINRRFYVNSVTADLGIGYRISFRKQRQPVSP